MNNSTPETNRIRQMVAGDNTWKVLEKLDSEGNFVESEYYFKGKRCKREIILTHLSRQLSGYRLIEKDIRNILTWLNYIKMLYNRSYGKDVTINGSFLNRNSKTKTATKADIFSGISVARQKQIDTVDTPAEALAVSLSQYGRVNIPYMSSATGMNYPGASKSETHL